MTSRSQTKHVMPSNLWQFVMIFFNNQFSYNIGKKSHIFGYQPLEYYQLVKLIGDV